jgi:aryl-alcohol dehydrogenase-like predicted oxidoreductase
LTIERRQLGQTDLSVSIIGFGAWAIGAGGWSYGWGSQDDRQSVETLRRALQCGINWIDTAAVYGLGHSERVIAEALRGQVEKPYIFTKCSRVWDEDGAITGNLKPDSIRRELEASLERLDVSAIDLYQIHQAAPDEDIEEGWATLAELKGEGLVRHIGVSNFNVDQLVRAHTIAPIATLQVGYSLVNRGIEEDVLPFCREHQIGVLAYSPMASGLLSGSMTRERLAQLPRDDWRRGDLEIQRGRPIPGLAWFQEPQLTENLALVDQLRQVAERHHRCPGAVAIEWVLRQPGVTAAIVGFRRPDQLDDPLKGSRFALSADELEVIAARPAAT